MADTRHKNTDWTIQRNSITGNVSFDGAQLAVLMDIRDELQALVRILRCPDTQSIPRLLREIRRNTARFKCRVRGCGATSETARGLDQHRRRSHQVKA